MSLRGAALLEPKPAPFDALSQAMRRKVAGRGDTPKEDSPMYDEADDNRDYDVFANPALMDDEPTRTPAT